MKNQTEQTRYAADLEQFGYRRCDWSFHGERCHYPGSMSDSITGEGPWYCAQHMRKPNPALGAAIIEASRGFSRGGQIVETPQPKPKAA